MNKTMVVALRTISAVMLLPVGLKILPMVSKVFPDFKTQPWFVVSLFFFLTFALVSPLLTIVSAFKAESATGNRWAWLAFGLGLLASFCPFLGRFAQFHVWVLDEIKVDFGILMTDPRIFQYLFIVRDVGLVLLLMSILASKPQGSHRH